MNPASTIQDCIQYVPSLVAPTQMVQVQHLSQPHRPLSTQDIYVLQRTALPVGQLWAYALHAPGQPSEMVQIQMWTTPTLTPCDPLYVPMGAMPPQVDYVALATAAAELAAGYEADGESNRSNMTEAIYGPQ